MSWILMIILYTGEVKQIAYATQEQCETALMSETDMGKYKHIEIAECFLKE